MFKWTRTEPGHYTGTEGGHTARIYRTREGALFSRGEVMWVTAVDGQYVTNADTLAMGKLAANDRLTELAQ